MPTSPGAIDAQPAEGALDADLGWAIGVVFRGYLKAVDAVISDLPGGPRGYQVLASAAQDTAGNQGKLSQQLGIDRTVLTYLIDDLEKFGLVERHPDPSDRRSRRVVATPHGQEIYKERQQALNHAEELALAPLGPEAPTFRTLLQRLATHLNTQDPVATTCEVIAQLTPANPTSAG